VDAKEIHNVFTDPEFVVDILNVFNKYGIVSDIELRNAQIRKEWIESKQNGEANKDFVERSAAKYFRSPKNIEFILYGKKK
jgi:hypothetical protein